MGLGGSSGFFLREIFIFRVDHIEQGISAEWRNNANCLGERLVFVKAFYGGAAIGPAGADVLRMGSVVWPHLETVKHLGSEFECHWCSA